MDPELLRSMKMLILEILQRPKHIKEVKQELREITQRHTCRYTVYVMILGVYPPGQLAVNEVRCPSRRVVAQSPVCRRWSRVGPAMAV